jgi:YesN/AraC family two-component response regulator
MDGITCIKHILDFDPGAKIVIISGFEKSDLDGIDEKIAKYIKGYLTKPCGAEELSQMISKVLME